MAPLIKNFLRDLFMILVLQFGKIPMILPADTTAFLDRVEKDSPGISQAQTVPCCLKRQSPDLEGR